jgi:hypothetical protein
VWFAKLFNMRYWKLRADSIVYAVHEWSSNYGTSWVRPLGWMLVIAFIFAFGFCQYIYCDHKWCWEIEYNPAIWHEVAKYLSIFYLGDNEKNFFKAYPWLLIVHKASLGYLYYQFIMAVRKDTKK